MTRLARVGLLCLLFKVHSRTYESFITRKATRRSFGKAKRASSFVELVQLDIFRPTNVITRYVAYYFIHLLMNTVDKNWFT